MSADCLLFLLGILKDYRTRGPGTYSAPPPTRTSESDIRPPLDSAGSGGMGRIGHPRIHPEEVPMSSEPETVDEATSETAGEPAENPPPCPCGASADPSAVCICDPVGGEGG